LFAFLIRPRREDALHAALAVATIVAASAVVACALLALAAVVPLRALGAITPLVALAAFGAFTFVPIGAVCVLVSRARRIAARRTVGPRPWARVMLGGGRRK
jgi:hypothetical protein